MRVFSRVFISRLTCPGPLPAREDLRQWDKAEGRSETAREADMGKVPNHKAKKGHNKKGTLHCKTLARERFLNRHIDQVGRLFVFELCMRCVL